MTIAICHFVRFLGSSGSPISGYNFQNFFVNQLSTYQSVSYNFAPIGVTAGAGTKGGDRGDAVLVAPSYPLVANLFAEACKSSWLCQITMVLLDPQTYATVQQITQETWICSRAEINTERATLRLASPLDAVDAHVPKRTLSSKLVGSLPSTGAITVS
jgi:hypothetical protein